MNITAHPPILEGGKERGKKKGGGVSPLRAAQASCSTYTCMINIKQSTVLHLPPLGISAY